MTNRRLKVYQGATLRSAKPSSIYLVPYGCENEHVQPMYPQFSLLQSLRFDLHAMFAYYWDAVLQRPCGEGLLQFIFMVDYSILGANMILLMAHEEAIRLLLRSNRISWKRFSKQVCIPKQLWQGTSGRSIPRLMEHIVLICCCRICHIAVLCGRIWTGWTGMKCFGRSAFRQERISI